MERLILAALLVDRAAEAMIPPIFYAWLRDRLHDVGVFVCEHCC